MKNRYAFWPAGGSYRFAKDDLRVYTWNFYWMSPEEVDGCPVPYEIAPPDESAVGTRLKSMFRLVGFHADSGCQCDALAGMLDAAGLDFIENHVDEVVELIRDSAAQLGVPAPRLILKRLVKLAIWRERKCLAASTA